MQTRSTDSRRLSATLEDESVQIPSQPSMLGATYKVRVLIAKQDELIVRFNEYTVCKENLKRKVFAQEIII